MTELKTRTRTCDHCGADLTKTDSAYAWHYVLSGEFTPSRAIICYDPHPNPPETRHFCDNECLARWSGETAGDHISCEMFDAGGNVLADAGVLGGGSNYGNQRKLAITIFRAMWAARKSSVGSQEREAGISANGETPPSPGK